MGLRPDTDEPGELANMCPMSFRQGMVIIWVGNLPDCIRSRAPLLSSNSRATQVSRPKAANPTKPTNQLPPWALTEKHEQHSAVPLGK